MRSPPWPSHVACLFNDILLCLTLGTTPGTFPSKTSFYPRTHSASQKRLRPFCAHFADWASEAAAQRVWVPLWVIVRLPDVSTWARCPVSLEMGRWGTAKGRTGDAALPWAHQREQQPRSLLSCGREAQRVAKTTPSHSCRFTGVGRLLRPQTMPGYCTSQERTMKVTNPPRCLQPHPPATPGIVLH